MEGEGPLGGLLDQVFSDERCGQASFELAEKRLFLEAVHRAIKKAGLQTGDIQFLLGGDLLNQIITSAFSARELGIPVAMTAEQADISGMTACVLADAGERRESECIPS